MGKEAWALLGIWAGIRMLNDRGTTKMEEITSSCMMVDFESTITIPLTRSGVGEGMNN